MISNISKITVYVNDQDEAVKFWTEKCDFEIKANNEMGPGMRWIEVGPKNSDTTFVIYNKELMKSQNPNTNVEHPSIILNTRNIEGTYKTLKENGVSVQDIMRNPFVDMFIFADNEDNEYIVSCTK